MKKIRDKNSQTLLEIMNIRQECQEISINLRFERTENRFVHAVYHGVHVHTFHNFYIQGVWSYTFI